MDAPHSHVITLPSPRHHVRVRVCAWGRTEADVETAIECAALGAGRVDWEFADIERAAAAPRLIDLDDPKALAADRDMNDECTWAYVVYPVGGTE